MATGEDVGFLEESSNENPNEAVSNRGPGGEPVLTESVRASSSPAILELSKEEFRNKNSGKPTVPLKERLTRSCSPQLPETTPLLKANAESRGRLENEQDTGVEQVGERPCSGCLDLLDCCLESVIAFRNSKVILVLPIVFATLPLSAIIMGILYAGKCRYLPISGALVGVIGLIFIALWIFLILCRERGTPCSDTEKFQICFLLLALIIIVIIDIAFVSLKSTSFTKGDKNYCHKTFYDYSVRKEVWIVTAFVASAIFYLPRSRHFLCCCCSSRPTLPTMRYLSIQSMD